MALNKIGVTTDVLNIFSGAVMIIIILSVFLGVKDFVPNLMPISCDRNFNPTITILGIPIFNSSILTVIASGKSSSWSTSSIVE